MTLSVMYIRNKATVEFEPVKTIKGNKGDTGDVEGIEYWENAPKANGTASPGTSDLMARGDHVHPMPTAQDIGARPDTWMPTAQDVGARPDNWMPAARDVGARPDDWTPTVQEVGGVVGILEIDVSTGSSINSESNHNVTVKFTPIEGANKYYVATNAPGSPYGYVTAASVSGDELTVRLRNTSSGSHSVSARVLIIGMA